MLWPKNLGRYLLVIYISIIVHSVFLNEETLEKNIVCEFETNWSKSNEDTASNLTARN